MTTTLRDPIATVTVSYRGYDHTKDTLVRRIAGKPCDTGFGFGERDLMFDFVYVGAAYRFAGRMRKHLPQSFKVTTFVDDE